MDGRSTLLALVLLMLLQLHLVESGFFGTRPAASDKAEKPTGDDEDVDDFVLEHVISHEETRNKDAADSRLSWLQSMLLMKMLWMAAPKRQASHRIRFYSSASPKTKDLSPASLSKSMSLMDSAIESDAVASSQQLFPAYDDPETVANFAKMTSNAYLARVFSGWRNVTDFEMADGFGWDEPGLRGYVFVNRARSIVIVSFKGTSILLGGGDTVGRDKHQDNMMFSCCCARVDLSWIPVCGCYSGGYLSRGQTCSQECLRDAVRQDTESYFMQAQSIVDRLRQIYPTARLWFTGHSLGGAIANLMALANPNTSSISFEAPGERLYAQRMGLLPEGDDEYAASRPIWNFGISTDPIYMGRCNGITSSCYLSGYALETGCRAGHDCVWVKEGREDVGTHRIDWVIDNVILADPPLTHPTCQPVRNCRDCENWSFT